MGSTLISRAHTAQTDNSITRYYDISPTTNSGLNATLNFYYDESELNGVVESELTLYKSTDNGSIWTIEGGIVDTDNNKVTLSGIDGFSRWTLARDEVMFTEITPSFNSIDVGGYSAPAFTDIDGDGLLNLLIGNQSGYISHYEQNSVNSTSFTLVTDSFNSIDVGNWSAPTIADLDGDGLLDILIGEEDGNINHYEQDAINSTLFTLVTENFNSIDVGIWSALTFTDLDGDGFARYAHRCRKRNGFSLRAECCQLHSFYAGKQVLLIP